MEKGLKKGLFAIGLKIMAIYALIQAIRVLESVVMTFFHITRPANISGYYFILPFVLYLIVFIVLWKRNDKIAGTLFDDVEKNDIHDEWKIEIQKALFPVVGVIIIVFTIPRFILSLENLIINLFHPPTTRLTTYTNVGVPVYLLQLLLGVYFLFWSDKFVRFLNSVRLRMQSYADESIDETDDRETDD